ncbi:zinc-dependent alcohol dehydrogenase [Psychromicrobium xiongbiense]|uniref:zinc-dependent alcohol dehydrogenase n=1 Tax=Psychromicrobium xiongbiense TaxID=3051184 RepID=UPI002555EA25|nr:alcohol dehydrogenase catalytic domain-containing protein [Psychromicrobium sp. YIM S02556]
MIRGPRDAAVIEVPEPEVGAGQVLIDVHRVGVCGTDTELYTGEMQYLHDGNASYPLRPGHEWMGVVVSAGEGVDPMWIGRRVTGDTMIGCGRCVRCLAGRHHVCEDRHELGVRGGMAGALAERLAYPARYLHALPDSVDDVAGALVEPAGNALRSVWAAALESGGRVLILGAGTIGLLAAMFARAADLEVHIMGRSERSVEFARSLGFDCAWAEGALPELPWDAVIDCSNDPSLPAKALGLVEPGRRVVYVGLAGSPSLLDSRTLALKDVTAVGILGASQALDDVIAAFANGSVDPRGIVAAAVELDHLGRILDGARPQPAGLGPKIHITIPRAERPSKDGDV